MCVLPDPCFCPVAFRKSLCARSPAADMAFHWLQCRIPSVVCSIHLQTSQSPIVQFGMSIRERFWTIGKFFDLKETSLDCGTVSFHCIEVAPSSRDVTMWSPKSGWIFIRKNYKKKSYERFDFIVCKAGDDFWMLSTLGKEGTRLC
ncbi:hypothetical protein HYC85_031306 [Camellia sinensis]|uniref:Uncharacterized protein n=1 Tax=Camellia sinensis TaxID=4442 RepID=A0A7J7FQ92_CAMSI|nr:hypothetical protein HYC85_031306 [Camellia sinensis]